MRFLYVAVTADPSLAIQFAKVGIATNWRQRLSGLRTGCPFPLRMDYVMEVPGGAREWEWTIHQTEKDNKTHAQNEWFYFTEKFRTSVEWFLTGRVIPGSLIVYAGEETIRGANLRRLAA